MTSPERRAEASGVSAVFHAALTYLGFKTLGESIQLWADMPTDKAQIASASGRWITYALSLTGKRRQHTRDLAISYYRLVRALQTGYTIVDPLASEPETEAVPLADLRRDFYEKVEEYAPEVLAGDTVDAPGSLTEDTEDFSDVKAPEATAEETVEQEPLDVADELEQQDTAAEEEARIVLEALGPANLEKKLDAVDDQLTAKEADTLREQARRQAGNRQASAAERVAMNGARGALWSMARKDHRVIGYVRVSRTGTPCGWCAMLISRGLVLYKSEASAGFATADAEKRAEGELYHDLCHCYAEPVFSQEHYNSDPRFDLNRRYKELWKEISKKADEEDEEVLTAWRRYFRQNKD